MEIEKNIWLALQPQGNNPKANKRNYLLLLILGETLSLAAERNAGFDTRHHICISWADAMIYIILIHYTSLLL